MKYSVIIPTMWVPNTFNIQLMDMCICPEISEIIIINNKVDSTPNYSILSDPKIRMINQESNIYVNPAWNLGVSLATNEFICLLNDDILFDTSVFDFLSDKFSDTIGMFAINMYDNSSTLHLTRAERVVAGFGCMMFFHKNSYVPIPDPLKIMYGDNFMFHEMGKFSNKEIVLINGVSNNRVTSITCHTLQDSDDVATLRTNNPDSISSIEFRYWKQYITSNHVLRSHYSDSLIDIKPCHIYIGL